MALLHEEEDDHISQDKRKKQGAEGRQTSEPEKAHPMSEFVIVAKFGGHVLRRLASSLLNMIRQAGRQKFQFRWLFWNSVFGIWLLFSGFKCYIRLWWCQNYSVSMLFFAYDILRMVFMGGSLRGARHFLVDPY